jgi:hypothetical protein
MARAQAAEKSMSKTASYDLTQDHIDALCSELDADMILTVTAERDSRQRLLRLEFVLDPESAALQREEKEGNPPPRQSSESQERNDHLWDQWKEMCT